MNILNSAKIKIYSLFLGILYVFISYGTANLFFPENISIAMIMLITLLFVPTISRFIEKDVESRNENKNVFSNHRKIVEIFLFLFIGISIGYLIIGNIYPDSTTYQSSLLEDKITVNLDFQKTSQATSLMINNLEVILVAFILSLFYDAGALFLIVRTASVFSSFILKLSDFVIQKTAVNSLIFSIHFVPEILGFLIAALAGGVISKAVMKKGIGKSQFRELIRDGTKLLGLAVLLIIAAALLEAFVTPEVIRPFLSKV